MRIRKYILAALLGALCLSAAAQSRRDIAALDSLAAVSDSAAVRGLVLRKATLSTIWSKRTLRCATTTRRSSGSRTMPP